MNKRKWYGFTEDLVFGEVMQNKEFCKYVIQATLPQLKDIKIISIESQKEFKGTDAQEKNIRLDILVKDHTGKLFDIEMQNANKHNLGKRMRYYQSRIDTFALDSGSTYNNLKSTYIVFLCMFDYFNQGKASYTFHEYEDSNKELQLDTGSTKVIINGKATAVDDLKLRSIIELMRDQVTLSDANKEIKYAVEKINQINNDPKKRSVIMEYETRLLEEQQYGEQKGLEKGLKQGREEGIQQANLNTLVLTKQIKNLKLKGLTNKEIYDQLNKESNSLNGKNLKELIELFD